MNPNHDEKGRFASGPGGVGKMSTKNLRSIVKDLDQDQLSEDDIDQMSRFELKEIVQRQAAIPINISGRGSKSIDVTKQFASGKSPFSLITHIGNKPIKSR